MLLEFSFQKQKDIWALHFDMNGDDDQLTIWERICTINDFSNWNRICGIYEMEPLKSNVYICPKVKIFDRQLPQGHKSTYLDTHWKISDRQNNKWFTYLHWHRLLGKNNI